MKHLTMALVFALVSANAVMAEDKPAAATPPPAQEKPKDAVLDGGSIAQTNAKPLEEVLAVEKDPNGKHIMVSTHVLVVDPNAKQGLKVRFVDVKPTPSVYIKEWAPKVRELKAGTLLLVKGELHFGTVKSGTPSVRYKVREISGRKYNDHRHWRTDRAIYIINPTHEIVPADSVKIEDEPKEEKQENQ